MENEKNIIEKLKELPDEFSTLPLSKQQNREFIIKCLENKVPILEFLSDLYKNDKEIVLLAIRTNPRSTSPFNFTTSPLYYASEALKNDIDFVKEVFNYDKNAFPSISERLKCDKNIVLYALECLLTYKIRCNVSSCENIVFNSPGIEEKYNNDRDVVMLSMKINGWEIWKASKKLQKDFDILIESALTSGTLGLHRLPQRRLPFLGEDEFQHLSKNEKESYIIEYLNKLGNSNKYYDINSYSEYYFISKKVAMAIISCHSIYSKAESQLKAFNSIPEIYRNDKEVVMHAIRKNPKLFEFIDESFKKDKEVLDVLPKS
jgi:hypothetical protein